MPDISIEEVLKHVGVPVDSLIMNSTELRTIIKEMQLTKATLEALYKSSDSLVIQRKSTTRAKGAVNVKMLEGAQEDFLINGGLKVFHLHYNGEIYLLNARQAKEFSRRILEKSQEKLSKVNQIAFDDALALGSMVKKVTSK